MVFLKSVVLIISFTVSISKVTAYYCNHNLCGDEQYCCGDNLCCDYVYSLWYFWVGVVFLILMLSACGGFFRYCYDNNHYVVLQNFAVFPSEGKIDDNRAGSISLWMDANIPTPYPENSFHNNGMNSVAQGPPPPYTESTQNNGKAKEMSRPLYH